MDIQTPVIGPVVVLNQQNKNWSPLAVGIAVLLALAALIFSVLTLYYNAKSDKYSLKTDVSDAEKSAYGAAVFAAICLLVVLVVLAYVVATHFGNKVFYWLVAFIALALIVLIIAAGRAAVQLGQQLRKSDATSTETVAPIYWCIGASIVALLLTLALLFVSFTRSKVNTVSVAQVRPPSQTLPSLCPY